MARTVYRCEACGTVYSDVRDAESCERSHKRVEIITHQRFLHADVAGPYPVRVVCRMETGEVVEYERRKKR